MLYALRDELRQTIAMAQVEHTHTAARDFVLVGGTDAASRRADRFARRALRVHELVVGEHEMGALADVEASLDVDTVFHETVDLVEQRIGIEHDTVADRAANAGMEN